MPDPSSLRPAAARLGATLDQLRAAAGDGDPRAALRGLPADHLVAVGAALRLRSLVLRMRAADLRREAGQLSGDSRAARAAAARAVRAGRSAALGREPRDFE